MNGNFLVGVYPTEVEAAIAYNKAVDVVKSQSIDKNYAVNYIEEISNSEYADIYSRIKISKKLYHIDH